MDKGTAAFAVGVVSGLLMATSAAAVCETGEVESTFDADVDGWTHTGASVLQWQAAGGNPDGLLYVDNSEGPITYIFAPAKFRGDLVPCDGGSVGFDGNLLGQGGANYESGVDYGHLTISGPGGTATADLVPGPAPGNRPPFQAWSSYSLPFTAASFGVSQVLWTNILSNVTSVRLSVEALFGNEIEGIDNFQLGPPGPPVPTFPYVR
jgi:hypothetical protein